MPPYTATEHTPLDARYLSIQTLDRSLSNIASSAWAKGNMPSLFRFLMTTGTIAAIVCTGLYVLSVQFEPERHEVSKSVPGVKIRKQ